VSFAFDVFVSYSRRDSAFVERLVGMLCEAGLKVWLDVEQVPGGADIQETLKCGLEASRHVVAVLSENWLASDYTTWEVAASRADLHGERTLVPLALQLLDAKQLGPFFIRRNVLLWPPDDPDSDARFWEVYSALRCQAPGPRAEWSAKGRAARKSPAAGGGLPAATAADREARTVQRAVWGRGRAVLGVDRAEQWTAVTLHVDRCCHEALFVTGPRGEGHEIFLATVRECWPAKPPRHIRSVRWDNGVPSTRGGFRAALATTLECAEADLAATVRSRLRDQNLVLVHRPVLPARLEDEGLVNYYTRWLPEFLAEAGPAPGFLKAVQGIDWCPAPPLAGGLARLASRFGFGRAGWVDEGLQAAEAQQALDKIRAGADPRLPASLLPPLAPITAEHVQIWSESLPQDIDREAFVRDVLRGAKDSADILSQIADRLSNDERNG
jgi:TIR domain